MENWKHSKTIVDGEKYEISGVNIWSYPWIDTGEKIKLKDPLYSQNFTFNVYRIENGEINIEFAAGEFSNCVWGIYEKENKTINSVGSEKKLKKIPFVNSIMKYLGFIK